jgi:dihydroceramide fatty acyl 2-hydroxylase
MAVIFFLAGIPVWTLVEYLFHRYVLHGRFKQSKKFYKKFYTGLAHKYLDPLHWEHHERPFDGMHINGELKDLLLLFAVAAPLSFIFPLYTTPVLLAGVIQSYVAEEWIHHSIHYYNFRNPYFRYVKRYHLYHHSSRGMDNGFGITNGVWDVVFNTRFPDNVRQLLANRGKAQV